MIVIAVAALSCIFPWKSASADVATTIHDCASFRAWFALQPGSRLALDAFRAREPVAPAPKRGSDQFPIADVEETYFGGFVGGKGCMGGYYDAQHHLAAVVERYDTAQEYLETSVVSVPIGIRPGWVPAPTLNGAALGMTLPQIEAIEGRGTHVKSGDDLILIYAWKLKTDPQIGFSLKFLIVRGHAIAMDYLYGA